MRYKYFGSHLYRIENNDEKNAFYMKIYFNERIWHIRENKLCPDGGNWGWFANYRKMHVGRRKGNWNTVLFADNIQT